MFVCILGFCTQMQQVTSGLLGVWFSSFSRLIPIYFSIRSWIRVQTHPQLCVTSFCCTPFQAVYCFVIFRYMDISMYLCKYILLTMYLNMPKLLPVWNWGSSRLLCSFYLVNMWYDIAALAELLDNALDEVSLNRNTSFSFYHWKSLHGYI